jgi:hypothetical protein
VAVLLDRLADDRVVHNGQHLGQVVDQQLVIQRLVAVPQRLQECVLRERRRLADELPVRAHCLLLQRLRCRRQQAR